MAVRVHFQGFLESKEVATLTQLDHVLEADFYLGAPREYL